MLLWARYFPVSSWATRICVVLESFQFLKYQNVLKPFNYLSASQGCLRRNLDYWWAASPRPSSSLEGKALCSEPCWEEAGVMVLQHFCPGIAHMYLINTTLPGVRTADCVWHCYTGGFFFFPGAINVSKHLAPVFYWIGASFVFLLEYENCLQILWFCLYFDFCFFFFLLVFALKSGLSTEWMVCLLVIVWIWLCSMQWECYSMAKFLFPVTEIFIHRHFSNVFTQATFKCSGCAAADLG